MPAPRLLGAFDPLLLGWRSREELLGGHRQIVTVNGLLRPFALIEGRAAAVCCLAGEKVKITPFHELSRGRQRALHADALDVARYLGFGR